MPDVPKSTANPAPKPKSHRRRRFPIGPLRIRSKLIFLHTTFSLGLAAILLLTVRSPMHQLVRGAEQREAGLALAMTANAPEREFEDVTISVGSPSRLGLSASDAEIARLEPGAIVSGIDSAGRAIAFRFDETQESFVVATVRNTSAWAAVNRLYLVLTLALLAVYGLIALTLEVFVLPRQVYRPIATLRRADEAVQAGDRKGEVIPDHEIPSDELGQIMRSRNSSIIELRRQEQALEVALGRFELVAAELKRKNHLLETAKRNLADQDRLVSLGMMSAGLAHELNTPLAVIKGCVEELGASHTRSLPRERIELLDRVVSRLERLSESLLDFARVRPPRSQAVSIASVLDEAWTMVSLDRAARSDMLVGDIDASICVVGDAGRLTQVFVNLLRNAVDALDASEQSSRIQAKAETVDRDEQRWVTVTLTDSGPGIDPEKLQQIFEPFATTRLDAQGTGLGLAVAEGIVQEHGGVIIARNVPGAGAQFEVMLPAANEAGVTLPDVDDRRSDGDVSRS